MPPGWGGTVPGINPNDAHHRSVGADDVEAFAAVFTQGLDELGADDPASLVVAADRTDGSLDVALVDAARAEAVEAIEQAISGRRRILGMASRIAWAPAREGPSSPAWLVLVVGAGCPVIAAVRRDEDAGWWRVGREQLPWFALSTAAGLRAVVERGESLRLKVGGDPGLFRRPDEGEPPVDEHGSL